MFDDINNHNLKDASAIKFIAWFTIIIQSLFPISMNFIPSFAVAQSNTLQQWDNVETQPYIIKDGETIDNVAKKLNLSFSQLAKLNQFRIFSRGFENVKPGDEIDVPVNTGTPGNAANTLPVKMLYSDSTSTNITRNMNKTTHAENFGFIRSSDSANDIARTMINSAATEEIQKWLSQWGTTRAQVNLDKKLSLDGNSIDTLIPIYNTEDNTFFTQFGIRNKNGRNIFNIGGGGRAIWDNWLLGINSFYDHDISGGNRRIGLGVEAWGNYIQLSANSYFRLNNWQQSRDFSDYNERPANGFDIRANAWLPSFPQLGGKLVYEQYFGNHVALQDNHTLQKNPYSLTAGLNYTPFPLLTLGIDQQFGKGGNNDTQLSLQLTYRPGSSWESQINPSSVSGIRQMSENRYNLVERNNNFIFEYKKQDLISITLSKDEISGPENSIHLVSGQVKSKYELSQILWDSDKYISAGGRVSVVNNKNFNLTLPAYKTNGTPGESVEEANTYNINFVATDKKGNKSNSATLKVIVTSSGHSASARFTGTPVVTGSPSPANGTTAVQVGFTVTDGSGNPLPDQDVVITYNDGTSEKSVTVKTDTSGVAQADVTGTRAGDTAVTAQVNGQAQQAVVKFVPDAVSARFTGTPVVTGSPSPANGTTAVQVGFTVTDGNGNPLPDQDVVITYNDGTSEKSVTVKTDTSGVAQADVTGSRAGDTAVTAQVNGQAQQAVVKFVPDAVSARFTGTPVVTGSPSPANGTTAVQVGFTVTDGSGNPLPDQDVVITYNDGTAERSVTVKTDAGGVAQADVTGTRAGDTAVTAQVNGQAQQAVVKFVPDAVSARFTGTPVVTGSPSPANGTTAVQVGFTVTDGSGNPLPDQDVVITYNDGTSEKSVTVKTDTSGVAQADVTGTRAGDTAVTAQVNGQAQQAVVKFVPDAVSARFTGTPVVTGSPSPANGTTAVQVGFTVTDGSGNPLPDQDVVITYNDGTSEKSVTVKTDTSGVAQADVTGTRAGDTAVTAQVNGQAQQAVVKFVPDAVSARFTGTPVVTGSPSPANGTTAVQVGFTVTDGSGNPLPDQDVVITYNDGTAERSVTVKTDAGGVAQADVTGTRAGDTAVTAQVNGQAQQAVVKFVPDAVSARFTGTPVVTGSPAQADNSESITLTYKVIDKSGNTLPNQTITISVNNNAVSDNSSVVTDNQGEASFVVRNSQSGTTTVSASINSHDISTDIIFKPVIRTVVANKMLSAKAPVTGYAPVDTISTTAGVLTYSISPSLPAGLVLDSATGVISGTPAAASVVTTYTMTVRDGSSGAENSTTFSLGIAPALAVTQSLYSKVLSMNSNVNLTAINVTGGVSPVVSISPSLPQGLNLNASTGEITGIPTVETGATTYTISVTDQNASPVKRLTLSLTVAPGPVLTVNVQDKMATARASLIYTPVSSVSPVGGALTYSVSPTLPAGLGLNSTNGIISGTPAAASVVTTYTMTVRDGSSGAENSTTFSLGIAPALAVTQSLYSKVLSMNSNVNLTAINVTGGVSPVVSISPSLPQGLNLNASTGEITGIPTVETGATTYTISVTDQNASPVKRLTLSLTVAPGPDLTVNTADKMLAVGAGVNYLPVAGTSPVGGILSYRVSPPLPSGLGLNSTNGVISGTPRAVSSVMTYTMTVRDGRSGAENSVEFNISVLPRFVVTQTIYVRTVTSSTSVNIEVASVSGGSGTYRVSVSPALPTGLDLSIDATSGAVTVSGIPTAAASVQDYAITIQDDVVDGASNTRTLKLTVN
ncbi:inverse autotransporter beta domain-containing protein (plasmid) [Salmonella enterica subsp. enterica serovar Kentucky]|nr:inverse autotransporter beta domain-containing protein [Salmonella enterica]UAH55749.1 inverse autotransporter beta domain-containing protein [Salmonella enterica subsp. enterica serovar Kentucky]